MAMYIVGISTSQDVGGTPMALDRLPEALSNEFVMGGLVILFGVVLGLLVDRLNRRVLEGLGVPEAVEGTAFERTARNFGTSTVAILGRLSLWFVVGVSVLLALSIADLQYQLLWTRVTGFLPKLFVAVFVLIGGVLLGDKLELAVSERLRGVKLPQVNLLPRLLKYSVVYIAALVSLSQVGVATSALLVLLGAYAFAVVALSAVALKPLLQSGAAGMYLLLNQPYGIGDRVRIGDREGIVQEVTMFVTRIEADGEEHVLPNHLVFDRGIARVRE